MTPKLTPVIVGIDPGGASTGIAVRRGLDVLGFQVLNADGNHRSVPGLEELPHPDFLRSVIGMVEVLARGHDVTAYAIESVRGPSWFMGASGNRKPMNPKHLIAVSAVAGAITGALLARDLPVRFVAPGGNGSRPLATYPRELVGPREKTGGGILRHARSAWDVAGAAA